MKKQTKSESDIVVLLTQVQQQLAALDKKVDVLMSRCMSQPAAAPVVTAPAQVPASARPQEQPKLRPMFPAVCADCKSACEIPFKPGPDRPVYCKGCFSQRKNRSVSVKPTAPVEAVVYAAPVVETPAVQQKKRSVAPKKIETKKKPVVKKKK